MDLGPLDTRAALPLVAGFNEDYIILPVHRNVDKNHISYAMFHVARISRSDLSKAKLITPDLESTYLQYIVGDYLITSDTHGIQSEPNYVYPIYDNEERIEWNNEPIYHIAIPSDSDMKIAWINGTKFCTESGKFGPDYETSGPGALNIDENTIVLKVYDNPEFPDIIEPYTQTVAIDQDFVDSPIYTSDIDKTTGNFIINSDGYLYYATDEKGQLVSREKELSGYECLKHVKMLEVSDRYGHVAYEEYPMYLYFDGIRYLYFLYDNGTGTRICRLNIENGENILSDYTVDLESAATSYMSLSGTTLIYKTLNTGSSYTTYQVDITDLNTRPVAVDYNPGDVISIPEFRF